MQLAKTFEVPKQWSLNPVFVGLLVASPPQFHHIGVEEYRGNPAACDQPGVLPLRKSAAAQSQNLSRPIAELAQQLRERRLFRPTKRRFSRIAKDFRDFPPFARFNTRVEILKRPAQKVTQGPAHTAFARAHKADQDHSPRRPLRAFGRSFAATYTNSRSSCRPLRTPLAPIRFALRFGYCFSERFLR